MELENFAQRRPTLTTDQALNQLVPGRRFAQAAFETYLAHPAFPSQHRACQQVSAFVNRKAQPKRRFWTGRVEGKGLYLDGGFGVGKTHLLASAFHRVIEHAHPPYSARFVQFQVLTSLIGHLGMPSTVKLLEPVKFLCIDEFELDDPGDMHLIGTLLAQCMPAGLNVITTSNTPPDALGQGRFNASLFTATLSSLAARFEALTIDGPDYRQRQERQLLLLTEAQFVVWLQAHKQKRVAVVTCAELNGLLEQVHPSAFGALLHDVQALGVQRLTTFTHINPTMREQGAVRFVHFMDQVYSMGISVGMTGVDLNQVFEEAYLCGAFRRKYARCLSRMAELTQEAVKTTA